jgi:hypothetical protein
LTTGKAARALVVRKYFVGQFRPAGVLGRTKNSSLLFLKKGGKFQTDKLAIVDILSSFKFCFEINATVNFCFKISVDFSGGRVKVVKVLTYAGIA